MMSKKGMSIKQNRDVAAISAKKEALTSSCVFSIKISVSSPKEIHFLHYLKIYYLHKSIEPKKNKK